MVKGEGKINSDNLIDGRKPVFGDDKQIEIVNEHIRLAEKSLKKYVVCFEVTGGIDITVEAENEFEAKRLAQEILDEMDSKEISKYYEIEYNRTRELK